MRLSRHVWLAVVASGVVWAQSADKPSSDTPTELLDRKLEVQTLLKDTLEVLKATPVADTSDAGVNAHALHTLLATHKVILTELSRAAAPPINDLEEFKGLPEAVRASEDAAKALEVLVAQWKDSRVAPPPALEAGMRELEKADTRLIGVHKSAVELFESRTRPSAIIVSGGVSLGAYQAGLLNYYTQYFLKRREKIEVFSGALAEQPKFVTGASAGAVNAFLAGLAGCREAVDDPKASLFYKLWIDIGLDDLLVEDEVTSISLMSRIPIQAAVDQIKDLWSTDQGWRKEPCDVSLGFTVTRVRPRHISLDGADAKAKVKLPVQTERVLLRISKDVDKRPSFDTVAPGDDAGPDFYPEFRFDAAPHTFPEGAAEVLKASASFPLAWSFVPLESRLLNKTSWALGDFLDGGVFDNNPLRLASNLVRWRQARLATPDPKAPMPGVRQPPRFLYIEPDATDWGARVSQNIDARRSFLDTYPGLLADLVGTARRAELVATIEADPTIRDRIDVPLRRWPITGGYLLNFLAFLEKDFRRFDFFMGMADGKDQLLEDRDNHHELLGFDEHAFAGSPEFKCVDAFRQAVVAEEKVRAGTHAARDTAVRGLGVEAFKALDKVTAELAGEKSKAVKRAANKLNEARAASADRSVDPRFAQKVAAQMLEEEENAAERFAPADRAAQALVAAYRAEALALAKDLSVPSAGDKDDAAIRADVICNEALWPKKSPRDEAFTALLDTSLGMRNFLKGPCTFRAQGCTANEEFAEFGTQLYKNEYPFEDLMVPGNTVVDAMRRKIQPVVNRFTWEQSSFAEKAGMSIVGKIALDAMSVRPASWYFGIGLHSRNGFELEFSKHVAWFLSADLGLRITRISSRFLSGIAPAPTERYTATFEYYVDPISLASPGWCLPWFLRLRGQLGTGVNVTLANWRPAAFRVPLQWSVSIELLQRLYLRVNVSHFFDGCDVGNCNPSLGGLLGSYSTAGDRQQLLGANADWSVSLGWRILE